jgi:hypothetical protein
MDPRNNGEKEGRAQARDASNGDPARVLHL